MGALFYLQCNGNFHFNGFMRFLVTKSPTGNFPIYVYNLDKTVFKGIIYYQKDIKPILGCSETTFRRNLVLVGKIYCGNYKDYYFSQVPIPVNGQSPITLIDSWNTANNQAGA